MIYNITAATGHLSQKITEEDLKYISPEELVIFVRNPEKAERLFSNKVKINKDDYNSEQELTEQFKDTDVLIYIPSITFPNMPRLEEFVNAVNAAEKANVKHFIFVGFVADQEDNPFKMSPFFGYVPRRLAPSDLNNTYIPDGMNADPLAPYLPELDERKRLLYSAADGK